MNLKNHVLRMLIALLITGSTISFGMPSFPFKNKKEACAVLSLEHDTREETIKNAFSIIAQQYHPDKLMSQGESADEARTGEELIQRAGQARDYLIILEKINAYKAQAYGVKNIIAFLLYMPSGNLNVLEYFFGMNHEDGATEMVYNLWQKFCISIPVGIPLDAQELTEYSPYTILGYLAGSLTGKLPPIRRAFDTQLKPCVHAIACTGILYKSYTAILYLYNDIQKLRNNNIKSISAGILAALNAYGLYLSVPRLVQEIRALKAALQHNAQ